MHARTCLRFGAVSSMLVALRIFIARSVSDLSLALTTTILSVEAAAPGFERVVVLRTSSKAHHIEQGDDY